MQRVLYDEEITVDSARRVAWPVRASSNLIYRLLRMDEVFYEGSPSEIRAFRKPAEGGGAP
jgi:hypothetical protein